MLPSFGAVRGRPIKRTTIVVVTPIEDFTLKAMVAQTLGENKNSQ
jgi:hypothetical protein